ncbi:MAG TPA: hypothetical protein VKX17_25175 [Planctomycetota bacterium]|nr:hypothetical protein [Planctomycetota bacterium]
MQDLKRTIGFPPLEGDDAARERLLIVRYINLKLAALGFKAPSAKADTDLLDMAYDLVQNYREKVRLLADHLSPPDRRIQDFLNAHFSDMKLNGSINLPRNTLTLDRHGLAREMSLPVNKNTIESEIGSSYRVQQGVLHNPRSDRRTTKGVFHIAEGGLPVPADKIAVPKRVYGNMLHAALNPPRDLMKLPYTVGSDQEAEVMVSLLLRPIVSPEVPGIMPRKTMEVRFFVPGNLVCNLDFVESIFGNAGDPYLPENDAGLDVDHWTGHTGCVILAPHLVYVRKRDVGLPHWKDATERQRADGMCWKDPAECYNGGNAFKLVCRSMDGVMVTLIADNYFGYCKKEVKTQISMASNFFGLTEEEHAGGALAFPRYNYGDTLDATRPARRMHLEGHSFAEVARLYSSFIELKLEGYGVDKKYPAVIYVPEDVRIDLNSQRVSWDKDGRTQSIKLLQDHVYVMPSGYKVQLEKHPSAPSWRLCGTEAEPTFCHKPCTVSGGGKSELSKSITDAVLYGPIFVADAKKDFDLVDFILKRDYSDRFLPQFKPKYGPDRVTRPILSPQRSLGSVIKLLTPSPNEYAMEYNAWLQSVPNHIWAIVFIIKRFYNAEWGDDWRAHFSVDNVNGVPGHELKYHKRKLVGSYLRVGLERDGSWRTFKLRQDFLPAEKVQMEDDITASVVVPAEWIGRTGFQARPGEPKADGLGEPSYKLALNCEYRFFQRPDDAIHRGYDKQAERDMSQPGNFISNFQPLTREDAIELIEDPIHFDEFTQAMRDLIRKAAKAEHGTYFVSSAHPRLVDGKPTQNPRYLQVRPTLVNPLSEYVAEVGARLNRKLPADAAVIFPVNAVLAGRRNNPPDAKANLRPLAVYNPIHYQELPELFMDYICSLTGKSPSTTGAGSEGALTKGPFNALPATADLNTALVSYILTGLEGITTAAGYVGPQMSVGHDISLLIPEIWCRLQPHERDMAALVRDGFFEPMKDFEYKGRLVPASRLGYRVTARFVRTYFGRVFDNPAAVLDEAMLRPESQDMEIFVDGVENIVEAQRRVAQQYFDDDTIEDACPPIQALLHIMANGHWEGKGASHPDVRKMFTKEYLLASAWYRKRLEIKQTRDAEFLSNSIAYLKAFLSKPSHAEPIARLKLKERLHQCEETLAAVLSKDYLAKLVGTLGADPIHHIES